MSDIRVTKRDALRAFFAGGQAVALRGAAHTLFEAGGRRVLPEVAQRAVRAAVEQETGKLLAGVAMLSEGAAASAKLLPSAAVSTTAKLVGVQAARAAGMQVLRGMGRAAGVGALIDGAWGAAEAAYRYRKNTMTAGQACAHVAKEASTGAAATVAGAAAATLLVTMTGGLAVPAVFVVGAAASIGTKVGLNAWLASRAARTV